MGETKAVLLSLALGLVLIGSSQGQRGVAYKGRACDGEELKMMCSDGYEIRIQEAFFGRNDTTTCTDTTKSTNTFCGLATATAKVKSMCKGRRRCSVEASVLALGEPWPCNFRTSMFLKVDYTCERRMYTGLACESDILPIRCPPGQVIITDGAFWGREDNSDSVCPHTTVNNTQRCENETATDVFKMWCDGHEACDVDPHNSVFGDPCPGLYKYLRINYTCSDCENVHHSDAECEYWAMNGYCTNNDTDWMTLNCRRSCTKCSDEPLPCVNVDNEDYCEQFAATGECEANPAYMMAFCRRSCLKCDKPACIDKMLTADCEVLYNQGNCTSNPEYMLQQCAKTCTQCDPLATTAPGSRRGDERGSIPCEDDYAGENECAAWAANGDCETNPGFMIPFCTKTCLFCDEPIKCENLRGDADCEWYAAQGECGANPRWMYKNCWKACTMCNVSCENTHNNSAACDFWRNSGECAKNPSYMMRECYKSCSHCMPDAPEVRPRVASATGGKNSESEILALHRIDTVKHPSCKNAASDVDCDWWASQGQCSSNPGWMWAYCKQSCLRCNMSTPDAFGVAALPGNINEQTYGRSFIFKRSVTTYGKLTHFSAFMASTTPGYATVWRAGGGLLYQIYIQYVEPSGANMAQTFPVPDSECIYLEPGDRLGFTAISENDFIPVASNFDMIGVIENPTDRIYYRDLRWAPGSAFYILNIPYTFSLSAGINTSQTCS